MDLSNDLISQFAKLTKTEKNTKAESTHNGTIVNYNGSTYVQLDGSDLLTPISTTTDTKSGDRVTVMIKNHSATVTGNITSPSARTTDVQDIAGEVGTYSNRITEVEILVADKVSTDEFDAQVGRIDELVSDNIIVKDTVTANTAIVNEIKAENVVISDRLTAAEASIDRLETNILTAEVADIKYATIEDLDATNADIYNLRSTYGDFEVLTTNRFEAVDATIDNLSAVYATISDLDVERARIDILEADSLTANSAVIKSLQADVADIDTLIFGSASGNVIQTSFANAVIAQLGNAQIKSAMIESISADKITAGDIITNNVRVMSEDGSLLISDETIQISDDTRVRVQIGKDAAGDYSINIWDADGNLMFSEGGITDSAIKEAIIRDDMVSDTANISAHKLNIDSLFEEINGSTHTIQSSKILLDSEGQTLDVVFTDLTTDVDGLRETVSSQGTSLSVVQGQINTKVWQQDIDTAIDDRTNTLSTQYSSLEQTVNGISATVDNHTAEIAEKAEQSSVVAVEEQVAKLDLTVEEFKTEVSETYATKGELEGVNELVSVNKTAIEQNASDMTLRATKTELTNAINNIDVGGRNLLLATSSNVEMPETEEFVSYSKYKVYKFSPIVSDDVKAFLLSLKNGESFTLSFEVNVPRAYKDSSLSISRIGAYFPFLFTHTDGTKQYWYGTHSDGGVKTNRHTIDTIDNNSLVVFTETETSYVGRYSCYITPTGTGATLLQNFYANPDDYTVSCAGVAVEFNGFTTGGTLSKFKMELGNKATDWTPAPEDLETRVTNAEAKLLINTDSISSIVSRTTANETNIANNTTLATNAQTTADNAQTAAVNAQADIDDLEIGGRNLALNTAESKSYTMANATGNDSWNACNSYWSHGILLEIGQTYIISFDYEIDWGEVVMPSVASQIGPSIGSDNGTNAPGSYLHDTFSMVADLWNYGSGKYESGKFAYTFTNTKDVELYFAFRMLQSYSYDVTGITMTVSNFKLEIGNRATDWTPAPEDMATSDDLETVQSSAELVEERVTTAESLIQQLSDSISMLVTDGNGESLMVQTETGWTFSTAELQSAVDTTSENLDNLTNEMGDVNSTVGALQQAVDDLGILNDYVKIGTYEEEPCIELGESDSDFKLLITNTRIMFMEGSSVPAYINNQSLYIKKAVIEEELEQGEFIWKARSNGNLGLIWKGASS